MPGLGRAYVMYIVGVMSHVIARRAAVSIGT